MWRQLQILGAKPLFIGSYYRPTDRNILSLTEQISSLDKITQSETQVPNIILAGNFNAPSVVCEKIEPKSNTNYGLDINHGMIDTIQEHNMTQCNPHPTRECNILDLVCATSP